MRREISIELYVRMIYVIYCLCHEICLPQKISHLAKFKGLRKNKILSSFIVISLLRKIGFEEMNVQKFRNFVMTEFIKSGIHCIDKKIRQPHVNSTHKPKEVLAVRQISLSTGDWPSSLP